jgi:hypothetical protein
VEDAQLERDAADRRVAVLRSDLDELSEFQTLVDDIDARESLLTAAMDDELSWARVFGDLALSFSRDSSLTEIQAVTAEDAAPEGDIAAADADPEPEPDADTSVAQVTFTGYSVEEFAPGVAEVLADFAEAEGFFDSYLTTAIEEERGDSEVTGFEGRVELNDKAYTRRYEDGLPEESLQ